MGLTLNPMTRFWERIRIDGSCWLWTATLWPNGYAQMSINGIKRLIHRWAFETFRGPIPEGLQIDHLCRRKNCVNPAHLDVVTNRENTIRGDGPRLLGERQRGKTHCPQGHPYDEQNTYISSVGKRHCRKCWRIHTASYKKRQKAMTFSPVVTRRMRVWV